MDKLLPCPCCDADAHLSPHALVKTVAFYIQCEHCNLRTGTFSTEAEAIAAWNTRTGADKLTEDYTTLVERVARAIFRAGFHVDEAEALVNLKWDEWPADHDRAMRLARAAIAAMKGEG